MKDIKCVLRGVSCCGNIRVNILSHSSLPPGFFVSVTNYEELNICLVKIFISLELRSSVKGVSEK